MGDKPVFFLYLEFCDVIFLFLTGHTDMWLSASTVVSSSAAVSTGMETRSRNRRPSRQRISMCGLRWGWYTVWVHVSWGVCQFMLVCCKFHMLSGIASIAGILSFNVSWPVEARTNANYTMCLLLQVLYSRESECIIQNFYFYDYQQMWGIGGLIAFAYN